MRIVHERARSAVGMRRGDGRSGRGGTPGGGHNKNNCFAPACRNHSGGGGVDAPGSAPAQRSHENMLRLGTNIATKRRDSATRIKVVKLAANLLTNMRSRDIYMLLRPCFTLNASRVAFLHKSMSAALLNKRRGTRSISEQLSHGCCVPVC